MKVSINANLGRFLIISLLMINLLVLLRISTQLEKLDIPTSGLAAEIAKAIRSGN
jgi:hypothetical protein